MTIPKVGPNNGFWYTNSHGEVKKLTPKEVETLNFNNVKYVYLCNGDYRIEHNEPAIEHNEPAVENKKAETGSQTTQRGKYGETYGDSVEFNNTNFSEMQRAAIRQLKPRILEDLGSQIHENNPAYQHFKGILTNPYFVNELRSAVPDDAQDRDKFFKWISSYYNSLLDDSQKIEYKAGYTKQEIQDIIKKLFINTDKKCDSIKYEYYSSCRKEADEICSKAKIDENLYRQSYDEMITTLCANAKTEEDKKAQEYNILAGVREEKFWRRGYRSNARNEIYSAIMDNHREKIDKFLADWIKYNTIYEKIINECPEKIEDYIEHLYLDLVRCGRFKKRSSINEIDVAKDFRYLTDEELEEILPLDQKRDENGKPLFHSHGGRYYTREQAIQICDASGWGPSPNSVGYGPRDNGFWQKRVTSNPFNSEEKISDSKTSVPVQTLQLSKGFNSLNKFLRLTSILMQNLLLQANFHSV